MELIKLSFKDRLAHVELNRPKAHAINTAFAYELTEAMDSLAKADYIDGAVITAEGNIFSAGLDVVELYGYNQDGMDRFWEAFHGMLKALCAFPKPLAAAINGHAPAGGCVIAMCCDYRVMAEGDFRIGLNEVPVGLIVPRPVIDLATFVVGPRKASEMFLSGILMAPHAAKEFGLVHDLAPREEVVAWATRKVESWVEFSPAAWRGTKAFLRAPLLKAITMPVSDGYGETIREWWTPASRARIAKTIAGFKKK